MAVAVETRFERARRRVMDGMFSPKPTWGDGLTVMDDPKVRRQPLIIRQARAFEKVMREMPIAFGEDDLFAGRMALESPPLVIGRGTFPDYVTPEEAADAAAKGLSIKSVYGHIVPSYPRLLEKGLGGIKRDAQAQLARLAGLADSPEVQEKRDFLEAVVITLDAVVALAHRWADLAEVEARRAGPARAMELWRIAEACQQVPENPPRSFFEALQSFWLVHVAFHTTLNHMAAGRFDQYMYPFYHCDLAAGVLIQEEAQGLLDFLWLKFNERALADREAVEESVDVQAIETSLEKAWRERSPFGSGQKLEARDRIDANNHWLQNVILGGQTPDGRDAANELSLMCLEAYRKLQMTNPVMTVRLHRSSPDWLVRKTCEVIREGGGMPAIFSDEVFVPALEAMGIPREDALDYTNDGCWETIVPGRTEFRFTRFGFLRCLEWALNRGRCRVDGKLEGLDTGDPRRFASFDEVLEAFKRQLDYMIRGIVEARVQGYGAVYDIAPQPFVSALLEGPIEKMTDMTRGGAKHVIYPLIADGVPHAVDSLVAVKKVIFEDRAATMAELIDALDANFEGREDLRQRLLAAPKYGNDDDYADSVGRACLEYYVARTREHASRYPWMRFPTGVGTFSWYVAIGGGLGATPDGRLARQPVSSNFSPALGADLNGPAAAILSHAKMGLRDFPTGSPLDLRLDGNLFEGEEGLERLMALVRTFVEVGGSMLTLTIADVETLRAAQREPEKYRSLRVRMGGWSAYFTALSKEQQEHHIRRQSGR